jgi:hypothetical protein
MLGSYYGFAAGSILTPYQAIAERVEAHNRQQQYQQQQYQQPGSLAAGAAAEGGRGKGVELELLTGTEVMGTGEQAGQAQLQVAARCGQQGL